MESYFDRFDIVEAHYIFCGEYHEGVRSKKYHMLSKMTGYFKPRYFLQKDGYEALTENGKEIYKMLVKKEVA